MLFGNKKIQFFIFIIFFFLSCNLYALENKILIKVNNEIITSLDINSEINYLIALNKNIENLDKKKKYNIAKNSLIRERIKKIEILNYVKKIEIEEKISDEILKSTYSRLGINSKAEFLMYIKNYNININTIVKKVSIEILWNQLIVSKFSDKIKINKDQLKNKILTKDNKEIKRYLLSEILFNVSNNNELQTKLNKIKASIEELGFENTAAIYSISDNSKIGGKLDWINEGILNEKIRNELNNINIGDLTNPIITPGGFLLLKIEDIKSIKKEIDLNKELKIMINTESNKQLNQYSNIYFNKISKNFQIDEL
jgi:peptidyl-prolyl cis-trans isomerase SurA|tara:strand:+ start:230 stop:1168 length:939 start_codon:yes stop_codon:yes gene_type:complete